MGSLLRVMKIDKPSCLGCALFESVAHRFDLNLGRQVLYNTVIIL